MNPWTPRPPAAGMTRRVVKDSPGWRAYLSSQGYSPAEIPGVLLGREAPPSSSGMVDAVELRVAALERSAIQEGRELDQDEVAKVRAGAVVLYLGDHLPIRVTRMDHRPEGFLPPAAFGNRLAPVGPGPGSAQILEDLATGNRWWTTGERGNLAGLAVVAAALYQVVGVAAPAARLVELDGERLAVHPEPRAWSSMARVLELHRATLSRELPADAWLGYRGGLAGLRGREHGMPASMASTMRLALGSTLGRAGGRKAPTWGVEVPELWELLATAPWKGTAPRSMLPMAELVAGVSERRIRQVVNAAQLEAGEAAALIATLLGRRDQVARAVLTLAGGAPPTG